MTFPLDTASGPSPDEESERHALIGRNLLVKARLELEQGDLLQASEKAWGAAAHSIKAVAEKRRWFSEADWKLRRVVEIITAESGDPNAYRCFSLVRDAHYNFYHHLYDAQTIGLAIAAASDLIDTLESSLDPGFAPPHVDEQTQAKIRSLEVPTSDPDRDRLANGRPPMEERPATVLPSQA